MYSYFRILRLIFICALVAVCVTESCRIEIVTKNLLFLDNKLSGLTVVQAKKLILQKLNEYSDEYIIIKYGGVEEVFLRKMFIRIDVDNIFSDLLIKNIQPSFFYSREDFISQLTKTELPTEIIDKAFSELIRGKTKIEVELTPADLLRKDIFILPLAGARLPVEKSHLPNAPRPYRAGKHRGVDFFSGYVGATVNKNTEIFSVFEGEIIRIDHNYSDISFQEWKKLSLDSIRRGFTTKENLDKFMGKQVHLRHGNGLKTIYAHLSWVRDDLQVGDRVSQGEMIARAGNTGTGGGLVHLHFEILINDEYLGKDLPLNQLKELYEYYFREW